MKLRTAVFGIATLFVSTASFAGMVSSSSNIDFLAIDGQKASKSLLKKNNSFNINDSNTHQVVVRVGEIVGSGSSQSLFESDPIIVTFQGSAEDIVISSPTIRTKTEAEKFNSTAISVKTASGQEIPAKIDTLKQEGLFPSANIVSDLANYNASGATAAVPALATATVQPMMGMIPVANGKATKGKVVIQGENIAEQQLQYWFQQADKETQTRFLNWAKSHK
ncbi:curli polymerization inhibitor CsgI-related protein [Rodentibacter pneumotropicus]|uniref:UPF0319 protein D3M76_10540 n=1 Tax=Rodentibacter pneumotropicus TaxID=758 RepID=A0A4S2P9F7_9PAST|nr:DUF2057 domain-containing protein [Rodentibacter pneumotropicus]NBH74661.1 DUF2057 domain-containing protein [Rodentibacter pneumotropicus]OOF65051.1 hypothetical protein BH925_05465 [Rodentibacter pneumotropicus]TGZ98367.1 DUF2057 domain-containing protein [Rodentibacter pneumotropicus]TGZ99701.1 DUF2057 domain-containing protein [Rodentibacter pneumotropicus]THA02221.1 DUF2057 domain-containing protein [Rodentibacter pneumotropicus]